MGLETKVILKMMLELVRSSKNLEEFEKKLIRIANVEGILDADDPPQAQTADQ